MKLTAFSVRHWQFTVVMFVMLGALGMAAWNTIPRLEDPPIDFPQFTVITVLPGASSTDLERLVVSEVEKRLDELDDVDKITSQIGDGVATTRIEFEASKDPDEKYADVVREVNALRPSLPPELVRLDVQKTSTLDVNILQVALVSPTASYRTLDSLGEALTDRFRAAPGVRTADRWAAPKRQVDVAVDMGRLNALGMSVGELMAAIGSESADIPAGSVETARRNFSVRSSGSYETLDEIRTTVVRGRDGRMVRVGDVADVRWGYADSTYRGRFNGERATFVTAQQARGTTISNVRNALVKELDAFRKTLPAGVKAELAFDQSVNVDHRLARLGEDFLIAILLVALTLLPLGGRAALVVMISIPLSLAIGLVLLNLLGFTLNQLTIVGMVIALGLLVDDSIVVVENIIRFRREGHSVVDAAIKGTSQIWVAVLGATMTLLFAFLPLLFLPGGAGMFIRSLPIAVVVTVLASLFVSLTIIPWLSTLLFKQPVAEHGNRFLQAFDRGIHATYAPVLDRALRQPRRTLLIALAIVAGAFALMPAVGFSLFPKAETPRFRVDITAPEGASIAVTDSAARFVERVLAQRPQVAAVYTSVGHDNPLMYYNVVPRVDSPRVGQLFVLLHEYSQRHTPRMLDSLRTELAAYPGADLKVLEFEQGPLIDAPIALRIEGHSLDTLASVARRVEALLEATPGTQYVTNPVRLARSDLRVAIQHGKAGLLGVPSVEIDRTVRLGLAGLKAGELREGAGDARDVVLRLAPGGRPRPEDLERLYVSNNQGRLLPLSQVARLQFERATPQIQRRDRVRSVTVTANVRTGFVTDRVTRDALAKVTAMPLPEGYRIVAAGEIESREQSFGGIGGAVLVAMFGILAILVLEFRTFRSTLIVASVIPLGIAGGILALFLTGFTLSFTASIGFVALIGIEIKTSILLVDLTNQLRAKGMGIEEAVRKAGELRFLPIVLTSLTAIGGLLPIAIQGSAMYAPLAWVIIGGLISSTLLARIVTPVMYQLIAPTVELEHAPVATTESVLPVVPGGQHA